MESLMATSDVYKRQMSRSLKKGPFVDAKLLQKVDKLNTDGKKAVIRTWSRASTVFPQLSLIHI